MQWRCRPYCTGLTPPTAAGFNFTAASADLDLVEETIAAAETWLLEADGRLLGTVTLRKEAATVNWLAVDPAAQGQGLGARLLAFAEEQARRRGQRRLRLDTPVTHPWLPDFYQRHGYQPVQVVHWEGKSYDSVILEKTLVPPPEQSGETQGQRSGTGE